MINQVVYGEVSLSFRSIEALDAALSADRFVRANLPWAAAFLAARSYQDYRQRGGTGTSTLPDFFIGAHAAALVLVCRAKLARAACSGPATCHAM